MVYSKDQNRGKRRFHLIIYIIAVLLEIGNYRSKNNCVNPWTSGYMCNANGERRRRCCKNCSPLYLRNRLEFSYVVFTDWSGSTSTQLLVCHVLQIENGGFQTGCSSGVVYSRQYMERDACIVRGALMMVITRAIFIDTTILNQPIPQLKFIRCHPIISLQRSRTVIKQHYKIFDGLPAEQLDWLIDWLLYGTSARKGY